MQSQQEFLKLYRKLNSKQKEAVDTIEGPVMVIAGPGTGKTQILTLRIANILRQTDTTPDSILALTFTESGAFSMRKRLVEIIGSAGYRVNIYTFHGFCNEIIRRFPDEFPRIIGAQSMTDIDKIRILKDLISELPLKILRPFGNTFHYLHPIRSKISELKRENVSPEGLLEMVKKEEEALAAMPKLFESGPHKGKVRGPYQRRERAVEKLTELQSVYEAYEAALTATHRYDYEDMILEVIRALEHSEGLLLSLQEEFQYVLADEHQDANNAQNRLLELLSSFHENPNLFIVGDEKQAIYRFQGASVENFTSFMERHPLAVSIALSDNYRSKQELLDGVGTLFESPAPLRAHRGSGAKILVGAFSSPEFERLYLAESIKEKIEAGISPHDIAVLYRNNSDARDIRGVFEKRGIPCVIESDEDALADPHMRKFLDLLRAIEDYGDDRLLFEVLHADFFSIDPLDIYKLQRHCTKERIPLTSVIGSSIEVRAAGVTQPEAVHRIGASISGWKKMSRNKSLLEFLEIVIRESGFLEVVVAQRGRDLLGKLNGFFDTVKALVEAHREYGLPELIEYLNLIEEHNVLVKKDKRAPGSGRVRLMTAHKSKGMEFDHVYVVGCYDTHWGNKRRVEHLPALFGTHNENDDERRLFYVALTRARDEVVITYATEGENGKPQLPAQFIEELNHSAIEYIATDGLEDPELRAGLLFLPRQHDIPLLQKEFLNELFVEQGLSVTALNNYLECPWKYFYSNLLRIPLAPNKHMLFGTAVHAALHDFFQLWKAGEDPSEEELLALFETHSTRQPFAEHEYPESFEKGMTALRAYFAHGNGLWPRDIHNEFKISVAYPLGLADCPTLRLRGDLDKVELIDGNRVNVVDYKTGRHKSRGEIEGNTKNSNGQYKRQLVFYKLLLDLFEDGKRFSMESGQIDFVEPNARGACRSERFFITTEDVVLLKEELAGAARGILDLSFFGSRCDDTKCGYCALGAAAEEGVTARESSRQRIA